MLFIESCKTIKDVTMDNQQETKVILIMGRVLRDYTLDIITRIKRDNDDDIVLHNLTVVINGLIACAFSKVKT